MDPTTSTHDTLRTRATLLDRIRNLDDSESWTEFFGLYRRFVTGVARKRGIREEDAEDLVQEVFWRVARTIRDFEQQARPGSFRRWLGQLVRWRAADRLRATERLVFESVHPRADDEGTAPLERVPAPAVEEEEFEREAHRYLLSRAFRRMEQTVAPKQIQVFQLLVLQNQDVAEVCRLLKMNRSAVYVAKHRVAERLRDEVERLKQELAPA